MSLFLYQNSYRVLRVSGGLGEPGQVNWDLALCLLLAWIVCYLCVCKGVKSSGKVIVLFLFKLLIHQKGLRLLLFVCWSSSSLPVCLSECCDLSKDLSGHRSSFICQSVNLLVSQSVSLSFSLFLRLPFLSSVFLARHILSFYLWHSIRSSTFSCSLSL